MVHGVRLKDGKAEWYRNRFIRSAELEGKGGPPAAGGLLNRRKLRRAVPVGYGVLLALGAMGIVSFLS